MLQSLISVFLLELGSEASLLNFKANSNLKLDFHVISIRIRIFISEFWVEFKACYPTFYSNKEPTAKLQILSFEIEKNSEVKFKPRPQCIWWSFKFGSKASNSNLNKSNNRNTKPGTRLKTRKRCFKSQTWIKIWKLSFRVEVRNEFGLFIYFLFAVD